MPRHLSYLGAATRACWRQISAAALLLACGDAYAQIAKVEENFNYVQAAIISIAATIITIMIMVAGIEVAARHRKLMEVWPIVLGAGLVAAAAGIAAYFVGK